MVSIMQGDSYNIVFQIKSGHGLLDISQVSIVEFSVGKIRKSYPTEVTYNNGVFSFPITQVEAFTLQKAVNAQGRVKFLSGDVQGVDFGEIKISKSISKVVI